MGELVIFENEMNKLELGNLSKTSMNIFMALCFKMKKKGDKHIVMDFSEVKELSGYKRNGDGRKSEKNFIVDLDTMTTQLLAVNSRIIVKDQSGNRRIFKFDIFPTFIIDEKERTLEVGVNPDFQWMLNEFEHYTSFDLEEIVSFKSKYTKNLYRLLRQWKSIGRFVVGEGGQEPSIDSFRRKIGVKDSYSTKEMLRSCIDVAVKEINASDCSVKGLKCERKYASRRGRPLSQIIFTWQKETKEKADQKNLEDITADSRYYTVREALKDNPEFTEANVADIAMAAKKNGVSAVEIKQRINYVLKRGSVRNPTGYIISLMRHFNSAVEIRNTVNSFNDFEYHDYDFDELEEMLLERSMEDAEMPRKPAKRLSDAVKKPSAPKRREGLKTIGNASKPDRVNYRPPVPVETPIHAEKESGENREEKMAESLKAIIEMMKNNPGNSGQPLQ